MWPKVWHPYREYHNENFSIGDTGGTGEVALDDTQIAAHTHTPIASLK